jgi:hypothetical protein
MLLSRNNNQPRLLAQRPRLIANRYDKLAGLLILPRDVLRVKRLIHL